MYRAIPPHPPPPFEPSVVAKVVWPCGTVDSLMTLCPSAATQVGVGSCGGWRRQRTRWRRHPPRTAPPAYGAGRGAQTVAALCSSAGRNLRGGWQRPASWRRQAGRVTKPPPPPWAALPPVLTLQWHPFLTCGPALLTSDYQVTVPTGHHLPPPTSKGRANRGGVAYPAEGGDARGGTVPPVQSRGGGQLDPPASDPPTFSGTNTCRGRGGGAPHVSALAADAASRARTTRRHPTRALALAGPHTLRVVGCCCVCGGDTPIIDFHT